MPARAGPRGGPPGRRGALPGGVEVAPAQLVRPEPEMGGAAPEDVLDDEHALRAAEATERRLGRLVGPGDPSANADVRDVVRVVDVAQRPGQHRLGQVEAPSSVRGQRGVQRAQAPIRVEADPPRGVEAVALAGQRHVLRPGEPHANRTTREGCAQRRNGGEAVRLHLLAPEPAAHAQRLDGHRVVGHAEDMRDDALRLARVLGAAVDEHLAGLVDERDGGLGLEVEVLLPGELDLAGEDVGRRREGGVHVAATDVEGGTLEAPCSDRFREGDDRRQRLVVDPVVSDRSGPEAGGLERLAEDPADGLAVVPDLGREERLVTLDARVVEPRHVGCGEDPHDSGHGEGRGWVEPRHAGHGRACPAPGGRAGLPGSGRAGRRCRARYRSRGARPTRGGWPGRRRRRWGDRTSGSCAHLRGPDSSGCGCASWSLSSAVPSIAVR